MLLNEIASSDSSIHVFDTNSMLALIYCGASYSVTSRKSDFTEDACKPLKGIVMLGIASDL